MLILENPALALHVAEDGSSTMLIDKVRRQSWRLDPARRGWRGEGESASPAVAPGNAVREGNRITVSYALPQGSLHFAWTLHADHVQVTLETDAKGVQAVALPGPFVPEGGPGELAVPLYQGVLIRPTGRAWEQRVGHGGHLNLTMAMGAAIGRSGALLATHDDPAHWTAVFGETEHGPFFCFEQQHCPADGWGEATVRFFATAPDLTSICKRYRQLLQQRGQFVGWDRKIAAKPALRELFGSLMAFIGYNRTPEIDYGTAAAQLRSFGFERVFYYPVRMCQYSLDFKMGGDDPIWLSDQEIAAMRAVEGAHVAPWAWVFEGLDDRSEQRRRIFRRDASGAWMPHWRIDDAQWYQACTPYQAEHMKQRLAGDLEAMDWLHFDVSAMFPGRPCFDREHEHHRGHVLGCGQDRAWISRMFSPETVGNRIVSSEGFADHYAPYYDIGSTKLMPSEEQKEGKGGPACMPVPMTMLVLHDSCVHDWWEVHNYNAIPGFGVYKQPHGLGRVGSGLPALKAAQDALYGCPPNVFPFGKQYAWADFATRRTYSFLIRLEDPQVQEALRAALPVARLHRRTGMCEMVSHEFLSDDRAVQATAFSDGTRVIANLSGRQQEAQGHGPIPAHSWRAGA